MSDEQKVLVELYKAYTSAKESFIDRNFATNRYYLSLSIILMIITLLIYTLTPSLPFISVVAGIGIVTSTLWYLNIDSYNILIKIKYAKVLEKMEENLPASPCKTEFQATQEYKKEKKAIIFTDLQKLFAVFVAGIFLVIFCWAVVKSCMPSTFENDVPSIHQTIDIKDMAE